jgi:hypothetical protein
MFMKPSRRRPRRAPAFPGDWSPPLRRLRTQMAVIATASTPLLRGDNLSEYYRGVLLFRGALTVVSGRINPGDGGPGLGLQFKTQDAEAYRVA